MRSNKQSRPRYKSRLNKDRVSLLPSMLLPCSSSLSDSESMSPRSRSSLILLLVLFACSFLSLSLTCNKISLHFRVVRPGMWQGQLTAQDTRPKTHTLAGILQKAVVRQLVFLLGCFCTTRVNTQLTTRHLKIFLLWLFNTPIKSFCWYSIYVLWRLRLRLWGGGYEVGKTT